MTHQFAIESKAVERYFLREMECPERGEFEEHYFACSECAEDVRAASLLIETAKTKTTFSSSPPSFLFKPRIPIIATLAFCFAAWGSGFNVGSSGWRVLAERALSVALRCEKATLSALESTKRFCEAYNGAAAQAHLTPADCNFERKGDAVARRER